MQHLTVRKKRYGKSSPDIHKIRKTSPISKNYTSARDTILRKYRKDDRKSNSISDAKDEKA